ncbi:MAG: hypothetical protein RDV48_31380 [Candidatus Eremiobacteraeota bacterium]|nr:hypothetical protein [Candidatus Eremiobacteraeota bacterium]
MAVTTYAVARKKQWMPMECETCGAFYDCLVEATGQASDDILPASRDELREGAMMNLDVALQKQAAGNPCPQCGAFPQSHVNRVLATAGRLIVWGLFIVLFIALAVLIAVVVPKAPAGIVFIVILIVSFIASRVLGGFLANRADPNSNLERNRQAAKDKIARGAMRLQSTPDDSRDG